MEPLVGHCRLRKTVRMCFSVWVLIVVAWSLPPSASAEGMMISGFTEPVNESRLGLAVTGRIVTIYHQEGARVEKGEPLLELDQKLERLEAERREIIWHSRAELDAVSRQIETLGSHLEDTRDLYASTGSVPREDLEDQELEYELATIEQRRLEVSEEREKREYGIAREELRKRTLKAPFSGHIVEVLVGPGENCEPDTPLIHLVSTSPVNFVANVELGVSQKLSLGKAVQLEFQVGTEDVRREAEIVFISPVVDPASGLRTIKARFDNRDGQVIPGVTGSMMFDLDTP